MSYSASAPLRFTSLFTLLWVLTSVVMVLARPNLLQGFGAVGHGRAELPATERAAPRRPLIAPAPPFGMTGQSAADVAHATDCLAQAIYYEAGIEPEAGQRAVAQVVLNRVRDRNFPQTVCGVVYQRSGRSRTCAFSFVCDGSLIRRPPGEAEWTQARRLAREALNGYVQPEVGTATHYHTDWCKPWWRDTVVEVAQVGAHIFYRWPGKAGLPGALTDRYRGGEVRVWAALHPIGRHGRERRRAA